MRRWPPLWDWLAGLLLAAVVLGPALRPGYLLHVDLVTVPRPVLTDDTLGLGDRLPRAVPWDAAVWGIAHVVADRYLGQLAALLALCMAAVGASRLVPVPAQASDGARVGAAVTAGLVAVWNPFVLEQLALGHVPHLLGYAAVPWVLRGVLRAGVMPATPPVLPSAVLPSAVLAAAVGSLTPGGGLLVLGAALTGAVVSLTSPKAGHLGHHAVFAGRARIHRLRGPLVIVAAALLAQTPWVLAGLLHPAPATAAASGPAAARSGGVFAVRAETAAGVFVDVLGLGGVWAQSLVPTSRTTWLALASTVLLLGLALTGLSPAYRSAPRLVITMGVLSGAGYLIALAPHLPLLDTWLNAVFELPGGGLLRDGHRWLAWSALTVAVLAGAAAGRFATAVGARRGWASPAVLVLLCSGVIAVAPDLALGLGGRLRPVEYPRDWYRVRQVLDTSTDPSSAAARLVILPWQPFRRFAWTAGDSVVLDPAPRMFPRPAIVDDGLTVAGRALPREGAAARAISDALHTGALSAETLNGQGVGWVLVEHGTAGTLPQLPDAATPVFEGSDLTLYRLDSTASAVSTWRRSVTDRVLMIAAHLLLAGIAVSALAAQARELGRRSRQRLVHRRRNTTG